MLQKKARKRALLLIALLLVSVLGIFLVLKSLDKNILYFKSPTDIKASQDIDFTKKIRVGGMVKKDSVIINLISSSVIIMEFFLTMPPTLNFLVKSISCLVLMSVGDLKYKIFLSNDFNTKKIANAETNKNAVKSDALFLTFF